MRNSIGKQTSCVLVTGGAGFIGSHVCERLQALGREVYAFDSLATGSRANLPPGVRLHVGDIRSRDDVDAVLVTGFDAIVHCAAQTSVERSMLDPELDRDVNVNGTHNLLEAARVFDVGRFVFMSSGGAIYGETEEPARESSVPQPRSFYGIHKYVGEEFVRASGLSFAILRPSNVYGPRQRADAEGGVLAIFVDRITAGQPLEVHGDGNQQRDFIHVDDVVAAIICALEVEEDTIWNVSSGVATTVLEAAHAAAEAVGRDPELTFGPRRVGDITQSILSPARLLGTGRWGPPRGLAGGLQALQAAIADSPELHNIAVR